LLLFFQKKKRFLQRRGATMDETKKEGIADQPVWSWLKPPAPHHRRYADTGVWVNRTIGDMAREWAGKEPDTLVFLREPANPTYGSTAADAEALARSFIELGLRPGDVVSFLLPNWYEAAVINLACAMAGLVINPIITIYRDAEVRPMLADCRAKLLFCCERFRNYDYAAMIGRIRPDLPALREVAWVRGQNGGVTYESLLQAGRGRAAPLPRVDPGSVKMLLYTSGTTGRPKGVLHSHNTLQRAIGPATPYWGFKPGDIMLIPSPVTHISGYSNGLEMPYLMGTRTILMESWDAQAALAIVDEYKVPAMLAATPFLQELTMAAEAAGTRLASLRYFGCGGASVPPEIVRTANRVFQNPCALRIYGSSEVPLITVGYLPRDNAELAATTDGISIDYEVRLIDDEGNDVPHGADGEIIARGPAMFMGYADEQQTRDALTPDGYFLTGDIGRFTPEGALLITGRKKDLIIRGGENISAKEIEDVLHQHPDIIEASVVSMPHERLGEGICAFLVLRPNTVLTHKEISAFVAASGLANQKRPERVEYVTTLPKTPSGKVRKDVLRAEIKAILAKG
jgi:acyl-CoA synthetase (AMP-forming)/AMP-acid ligase II